jgi:Mg-chelatase subunit ChlD
LDWACPIYLPHTLYYGYEGGRRGEVHVGDGTYLNIRTFYYAYADYRGAYKDNPFMLHLLQESPPAVPTGAYIKETAVAFTEIAGLNTLYSKGSADLAEQIVGILRREQGKTLDVVICIDTTGSMRRHIEAVRSQLIHALGEIISHFPSFRIGLVLYKDYREESLNRIIQFTSDFDVFQRNLNAIRVGGGGDIPEAVFEALHAGATGFPWAAESRIMILAGDAPPHPRPRGRISKQNADSELASREIKVHAIILPQ